MKIPLHVSVDDDTVIVIDGVSTITWSGFLKINTFEPEEVEEMRQALHDAGEFHRGGGEAARFHLTLLTLRVIESKLHELRRVRIDDSVFFKGIEPDKLAGETSRIADEIRTALEAMTRHNFPWNENYVATMEPGTPSPSPLQVPPAITSWRAPGTQC